MLSPAADDPILEKRARVARLVTVAMRVGYALFAIAMVLFFWALFTRFTSTLATATTVCLIVGSLVLAPAMVIKYAVKAAYRADRDGDW
ncbi:MAG: hypothetical protein OEZ14_17635 [Acidimicrobiia bacterium]|nr:hypothetical protein [Acidimicrobiia bacterium]MDH5522345.1 hypothetical protein [Acidimicrobiia bacterium]